MVVGENMVESVDTSGNWCLHVVMSAVVMGGFGVGTRWVVMGGLG